MKALIVDDSRVMRKVLKGALSRLGITDVGEARDGRDAVKAVEHEDFDFVLMDWNMPNMLGIDAVRSIRNGGNKIPIMMVTTESEKQRVIEAIKAGADGFVVKPLHPATLVQKLQDFITQKLS